MSHASIATPSRTRRSSVALNRAVASCIETLETRRMMAGYAVTDLGLVWGDYAFAVDLTDSGYVAGRAYDSNFIARTWIHRNGSSTQFAGFEGGWGVEPVAVNENGFGVGTAVTPEGTIRAVLFQPDGTMVDLGVLEGSDPFFGGSSAVGINNSGAVIGQSDGIIDTEFGPLYGSFAFVYENGQMKRLDLGGNSTASKISDSGYVIGTAESLGSFVGFVYDGSAIHEFSLGGSWTTVNDLNNSGTVVGAGYVANDLALHAFVYQNGQIISLHPEGTARSHAGDINDAGQIIGTAFIDHAQYAFELPIAFLHENGATTLIQPLEGHEATSASFISEAGHVVGTSHDIAADGSEVVSVFVYHNGVMTQVTPDGVNAMPKAVNNSGHVVGTMTVGGVEHGFLWNGSELIDLNSYLPAGSGWTIYEGAQINANGTILAHAYSAEGNMTAILLTVDDSTTEPEEPEEPQPPTIGSTIGHVSDMIADGDIDRLRGALLLVELNVANLLANAGANRLAAATLTATRLTVELYHRQGRISTADYETLSNDLNTLITNLLA